MNETQRGRRAPSEADMDALLRGFFEREMPREVKDLPDGERRIPARPSGGSRKKLSGHTFGVAVVASCLLLVAITLVTRPPQAAPEARSRARPEPNGRILTESGSPAATAAAAEAPVPDIGTAISGIELPEPDLTPSSPVEQRSKLRISNVSIYDPESGTTVELYLPELEIEIFPIQEDESEDGTPGKDEKPDRESGAEKRPR